MYALIRILLLDVYAYLAVDPKESRLYKHSDKGSHDNALMVDGCNLPVGCRDIYH